MPTVSKVRKGVYRHKTKLVYSKPIKVRESTNYEREVDELLGVISDIEHYYDASPTEDVESRIAGLENWAEQVKVQAERVRWAGILELVGSNSLRRE